MFSLMFLLPAAIPLYLTGESAGESAEWQRAFNDQGWAVVPLSVATNQAASDRAEQDRALLAQAQSALERAERLSLTMQIDSALRAFEDAIALFGRGVVEASDMRLPAQCLIGIGATWVVKGRKDRAFDAFRAASVLSSEVEPSTARYNPETVELYKSAKAAVLRQARGTLTVTGAPADAEVLLDGAPVGRVPLSLRDLLGGEHWVVVRHDGYEGFATRVPVLADAPARVEAFLSTQRQAESPLASACVWDAAVGEGCRALVERWLRARGEEQVVVVAGPIGQWRARMWSTSRQGHGPVLRGPTPAAVAAQMTRTDIVSPSSLAARADDRLPGVHPLVAVLPFGVGQFAERRYVAAALFLASEVLLLAANVTTAAWLAGERTGPNLYRSAARAQALQVVNWVSFFMLLADIATGGVDGFLHRSPPH